MQKFIQQLIIMSAIRFRSKSFSPNLMQVEVISITLHLRNCFHTTKITTAGWTPTMHWRNAPALAKTHASLIFVLVLAVRHATWPTDMVLMSPVLN